MAKQEVQKVEKVISIPGINFETATYKIVGVSPLLIDRMPTEVLQEIQEKQTGKNQTKKKIRNIDLEIERAVHKLPNGEIGFPAEGFKAGLIESTSFVGDKSFSKKLLKGIQIMNSINGLIPIKFKSRTICVHNIGANTKHTPQFNDWSCELVIKFDRNNISAEDIATAINYAGFYIGIGIWSPRCQSGGNHGMYEIEKRNNI